MQGAAVKELTRPERVSGPHALPIRRAELSDIPRMAEIAKRCVPLRNPERGAAWMAWHMPRAESLVTIGSASFCLSVVSLLYGYDRVVRLEVLHSIKGEAGPFEALRHLRVAAAWAKQLGLAFRFSSDAGTDLGLFARRLGGRRVPSTPNYEIGA